MLFGPNQSPMCGGFVQEMQSKACTQPVETEMESLRGQESCSYHSGRAIAPNNNRPCKRRYQPFTALHSTRKAHNTLHGYHESSLSQRSQNYSPLLLFELARVKLSGGKECWSEVGSAKFTASKNSNEAILSRFHVLQTRESP